MQLASTTPQLIFQVIGYKNTGKTTLVCRLTERFKQKGFKVGTIKRDAHDFQMDQPGTDTWKHQAAGADITAITSSRRTAIVKANPETLEQLISQMTEANVIIIEGFKEAHFPKIIMIQSETDYELLNQSVNPVAAALWPEIHSKELEGNPIPAKGIDDIDQLFQLITGSSADYRSY